MKKIVITAIIMGLISGATFAQTVSSANVVGYVKKTHPQGYRIVGLPFSITNSTPSELFKDTLPVGAKVIIYTNSAYSTSEYIEDFLGNRSWDTDFLIGASSAFWVQVPSTSTNNLSGDVRLADSITNSIKVGYQLLSYPYAVDRTIEQLEFAPSVGDKISVFNGAYVTAEYIEDFLGNRSWDNNLTIPADAGFWYASVSNIQWIVHRPF
jgi:hypothetical protein